MVTIGATVARPCGYQEEAHRLRLRPSAKTAQPRGSDCQGASVGASISDMCTFVYMYSWATFDFGQRIGGSRGTRPTLRFVDHATFFVAGVAGTSASASVFRPSTSVTSTSPNGRPFL